MKEGQGSCQRHMEREISGGDSRWIPQVRELYHDAFSRKERMPFSMIQTGAVPGSELIIYSVKGEFVGFAAVLTQGDLTNILYFAVVKELRGRGFGSAILVDLRQRYLGKLLAADIELPDKQTRKYQERLLRKDFFQNHSYQESGAGWHFKGTNHIVMVHGGNLTRETYWAFWDAFYVSWEKNRSGKVRKMEKCREGEENCLLAGKQEGRE